MAHLGKVRQGDVEPSDVAKRRRAIVSTTRRLYGTCSFDLLNLLLREKSSTADYNTSTSGRLNILVSESSDQTLSRRSTVSIYYVTNEYDPLSNTTYGSSDTGDDAKYDAKREQRRYKPMVIEASYQRISPVWSDGQIRSNFPMIILNR